MTSRHHWPLKTDRPKHLHTQPLTSHWPLYIQLKIRTRSETLLHLWGISVVEHAEDDVGHGVDSIIRVGWRCERGQVVLQGFTQHAVKCNIRPQDVTLLPAVLLQLLHLSPETVQILHRETQRKLITVKGQNSSQRVGCRSVLIESLTKKRGKNYLNIYLYINRHRINSM